MCVSALFIIMIYCYPFFSFFTRLILFHDLVILSCDFLLGRFCLESMHYKPAFFWAIFHVLVLVISIFAFWVLTNFALEFFRLLSFELLWNSLDFCRSEFCIVIKKHNRHVFRTLIYFMLPPFLFQYLVIIHYFHFAVGAAVVVVGLAAYRVYAARKSSSA